MGSGIGGSTMLRGSVSPILDHPESSPSSSKPSSSVLGELTQAKHDLGHNGGSEGNVTEPPEKGLLDTLLNKLYQLSGGRLGRVPASLVKFREERSKARAPNPQKSQRGRKERDRVGKFRKVCQWMG